jgi:hypothetical protein
LEQLGKYVIEVSTETLVQKHSEKEAVPKQHELQVNILMHALEALLNKDPLSLSLTASSSAAVATAHQHHFMGNAKLPRGKLGTERIRIIIC